VSRSDGTTGLRVEGLEVRRMGSPVVRDVSLDAPLGEVTVLLGTNGAGKTTLLEAISGIIPSAAGSIELLGRNITKLPRSSRARAGLAHVEQGRTIFADLTVEENLLVCAPASEIGAALEPFPLLVERRRGRAGLLSGGEQQMLVIARALATRPRLLMLDEMSLGLAPTIIKTLTPIVGDLADRGVGILLVEQFAALALSVGTRAYVLSRGEVVFSGSCSTLAENPAQLRDLYLGVGAGA